MKRFGLIGHPIGHSLSPLLFREAYAGRMSYDLIQTPSFDEAMERFVSAYDAVNVTAPFKEMAFRASDEADPYASRLEAANILVRTNGRIKAYNTDCPGVVMVLRQMQLRAGCDVLVVGCGGAGRAAALAALTLGCKVSIANRDFAKAERFAARTGAVPLKLGDIANNGSKTIIYTLPTDIEFPGTLFFGGKAVLEANYRDPFLEKQCTQQGGFYIPGTRWLAAQAICGFKVMTGLEPDGHLIERCLNLNNL